MSEKTDMKNKKLLWFILIVLGLLLIKPIYRWSDLRDVEKYTQELLMLPSDPTALNNRAAAYFALGEHELALQDLEAILRENPQLVDTRYNKAIILEDMGRFREAAEALAEEIVFYEEPGGIQVIRPDRLPELRRYYDLLLQRIAQE